MQACTFCTKKSKDVELLITSENANICNECVNAANHVINKHRAEKLGLNTSIKTYKK